MKISILTVLSLGLLSVAEAAVFPSKGAVNELTSKTWKNKLNDGNLAIVAFTAPWCGHCKSLAPEFLKAAESLSPLIPFHNVNCDEDENKSLCNDEGVKGFPTIKAYTKSTKSKGRTYERERNAGAIITWATDQVPLTKVTKLKNVAEIEPWQAAKPDQPHALLIHPSNPSVPLMWKVLSDRLSDKIHFGFIKDNKGEAKRSIGIETKDPKIDGVKVVAFYVNGDAKVYGAGPLKFEALLAHFKRVAAGDVSGASVQENQAYETVYETTVISTPTSSVVPASTENKAAKRQDAQAKWEEEERRDRLRREKREQERLARQFEDQERVTDEQDAQEDSGPQVVTPVQEAADPLQPADASMSAQLSDQTTAPDPVVPEEPGQVVLKAAETLLVTHGENQSPETPLDAASEDFNYGVSDSDEHAKKHDDQSAVTPLEEEAEEFEHGQHKAVLDESPTEERIKDEL